VKPVLALLALAYPFLMLAALYRFEARWVAVGLAALFTLRTAARLRSRPTMLSGRSVVFALLAASALSVAWAQNDERALLLAPVAVNATLLFVFASSLFRGATFVEQIARGRTPDLPPEEVRYCRSVTIAWCAFFLANGGCCGVLALAGERWMWAAYTGFVSYLLVGLFFAIEFTVRSWRFGRYGGSVVEPFFRWAFGPPRV
jgi:uncharacterized membrane protein